MCLRSKARWLSVLGPLIVILVAAPTTHAQQGEKRIGSRLITVDTDAVTGAVLDTGSTISFDAPWSLDFDLSWMVSHDWGVEWMITTAPHELGAGGGSFNGLDVGETWIAESTLTLQYYLPLWGRWRPYAGLGAGFAVFHSADLSEAARAVGVYDIRSDVGVGLTLQAGVSHRVNRSWVINFDIKYLDLPIDIRLTNADDVTMDRLKTDLDPVIIGLGAAWRF